MTDLTIDGGRGLTVDPFRVGDWAQTYTGKRFYVQDVLPKDIDLIDIAVALSNISRYGGHCEFYSVAEHSFLVSQMVPSEHRVAALLHDGAEAYLQDLTRPNKRALRDMGQFAGYAELDRSITTAILRKYGQSPELPTCVIEADTAICALEREVLHPRADPWDLPPAPRNLTIRCLKPSTARRVWLCELLWLLGESSNPYLDRLEALERQNRQAFSRHHLPKEKP